MKALKNHVIGIYLILFSLYSISTRFTMTAALMDGTWNNFMYRILLLAGCILAAWQLWNNKSNLKSRETRILAIFSGTLLIGIISNLHYSLVDNGYGFITFISQMVLFFLLAYDMEETWIRYYLIRIVFFCSFLWDIACLGSLAQYFLDMHYSTFYVDGHSAVRQGIVDGRLFGLFTDPNFAAFTSLLLVFGLCYIIRETKHRILRIFGYLSLITQIMYIIMSNSRTVYLSVIASVLFYVLYRTYKEKQDQPDMARSIVCSLLLRGVITLLLLVVVYAATMFTLKSIARIITPTRDTKTELIRDDVNDENISNNRFTIWTAYLQLYKEKPVFGYSFRSALPYSTQNNPDGYLAKTQYVTHNGYISLLVETGIVGFLIMAIFMIQLLARFLQRSKEKRPVSNTYVVFSTWILAILVFCLCFHDIFFTMNIETMLFWIGAGYLTHTR